MRILAASFFTERAAAAALEDLTLRFDVAATPLLAPLGRASDPAGPTTVLAGRFEDDVIDAVRRAVEDLGGTVVVDVDARFTHG